MRRILRIWPLYFVALGLAFTTGLIWPQFRVKPGCLIAYLLLLGNWYNVLREPMNSPWQPLWSITLEEQFYLLWPLLASRGQIYIWIFSLATFPVAAFTLAYCTGKLGYSPMAMQVWFNSLVQFQYFGLGAILALVLRGRIIRWSAYQQLLLGLASSALFYVSGVLFTRAPGSPAVFVAGYLLIGVACVALFLALVGDNASGFKRLFAGLGKISYGLYVFHLPCLVLLGLELEHIRRLTFHPFWFATLDVTAGLALAIGLAKLSYVSLERPFLRLKGHFEFVKTRSV